MASAKRIPYKLSLKQANKSCFRSIIISKCHLRTTEINLLLFCSPFRSKLPILLIAMYLWSNIQKKQTKYLVGQPNCKGDCPIYSQVFFCKFNVTAFPSHPLSKLSIVSSQTTNNLVVLKTQKISVI